MFHFFLYTVVLFVVLLSPVVVVKAQEKPNPLYATKTQFERGAFFRQNVCELQQRMFNKTVDLADALQGLELRPYMIQSEYFRLNDQGAIDEVYPGLKAVLLDKLAERAGFTWRNSYAVTGEGPEGNYTWTELLQWSAETYDISIDWWAFSIDRVSTGITFPEAWYDASIIMVAREAQGKNKDEFNFWAWLRPFDNSVWFLIVFTLFFSGFVYWILENIDQNSDKQRLEQNVWENIWLSAISFTSHFEFKPRTNAARLFTLSLSFWAMVMAAAYTANLASFLVVRNAKQLNIGSVADAVRLGVPICAQRSAQSDVAITKAYPNARIIRKETEPEVLQAVAAGDCTVAITTVSTWDNWQRDVTVNPDCNLNWIGRPFKVVPAGFATISDSGTYCTSLITDVLNLHMLRLKEEGFVAEAWNQFLLRKTTIDCAVMGDTSSSQADSVGNDQLNIQNMGGIFFFHGLLSFVAVLVAVVYHLTGWDKIPRFAKTGPLSRQAVRESLKQTSTAVSAMSSRAWAAAHGSSPNNNNNKKQQVAPLPYPQQVLLRAANKKTFSEHIGLRGTDLQKQKGQRNLFANTNSELTSPGMPQRSARNLFGLYTSDSALPSSKSMNIKSKSDGDILSNTRITLADSSGTQPEVIRTTTPDMNGYHSGNSLSRSDCHDEEETYGTPPENQQDVDAAEEEDAGDEQQALLHDLFMYDLHGPAMTLPNASRNSVVKRVKFADGTEHSENHGGESSALLKLAQRQDEQMRTMQLQISQIMQLLAEKKE